MASSKGIRLRVFDGLDREWATLRHSRAAVHALGGLADAEPVIAGLRARDLGELLATLRPGPGARQAPACIQAMLRSQGVHPLVPRALLQAIAPGLRSVGRQLDWGWGRPSEMDRFCVDLVSTAWEVIVDWAGQDRPYAVGDILGAVRLRLRRRLLAHKEVSRELASTTQAAPPPEPSVPWRSGPTDLDELAKALDGLSESPATRPAAATLYALSVLGYSASELAVMTGRSRRYLATQRDRAVELLAA